MCTQLNASYLQYRARNENEKNIENIDLVAKRENRPGRTTNRQSFGNGCMTLNVAAPNNFSEISREIATK